MEEGLFFQLKPKKAIINDYAEDLINFYTLIQNDKQKKEFKKELLDYVSNWEKIPKYISIFENKFIKLYEKYKNGKIDKKELNKLTTEILKKEEKKFNGLFLKKFCLDEDNLLEQITKNLTSKIQRISEIEKQRGSLPDGDLYKNIEM